MKKPIRILCVFANLNRGGAENMCMNLFRSIDRNEVIFDFVKHTREHCAFDEEIISLGGRIFIAPKYNIINRLQYEKWWRSFFKLHPEYKVVHGHYYSIADVYFKIAHEFGLITIGHSHTTGSTRKNLKTWIQNRAIPAIEARSDICLACSNEAGHYLFPHKHFEVLKNAIDVKRYIWNPEVSASVRRELGISEGVIVVGACGSFRPPKNVHGIVSIFCEVFQRNNQTMLLWIGDGPLREDAEASIKKEGLEDNVILTGIRSDVNRLMQAMDVFILPSLWEGVAVVSIEAQAAGLPCYFSDNVSKECAITDLCKFLPLDAYDHWAETILSTKVKRKNTAEIIEMAGYNISTTAKWIQSLYLELTNK